MVDAESTCPSCEVLYKTLSAHGFSSKTTKIHLSVVCLADKLYTLATHLKGITIHISSESKTTTQYILPFSGLIKFAKECLRDCSKEHASVCANLSDTSIELGGTPIILIDLENECLVFASSKRRYVALSYVWGSSDIRSKYSKWECSKKTLPNMLQKGFFKLDQSQFPPTILDAVRFTQRMGERYLWIDRYCIVQDDSQDKHSQLRAMGSIYYHARFTIIAAEGDITHGIQGLSGTSSSLKLRTCPRLCLDLKASIGVTYDPVTETTLWSTRGWTFQEHIFARRTFIFRGETLIFKCWKSVWHEGTAVPVPYDSSAYASGKTKLTIHKWPNMLYFKGLLEEYSLRDLTYPCDSLDALAGILGALEASFPRGFLFGLPEVCFDIALLWQLGGNLEDRIVLAKSEDKPTQDLPSWSWARWKGPLDFTMWEAAAECLFLSFYTQNFCSIKSIVEWRKETRSQGNSVRVSDDYGRGRDLVWNSSLPTSMGWKRSRLYGDFSQRSTLNYRLDSPNYKFSHESLGSNITFRFPIPLPTLSPGTTEDYHSWSPHIKGRVKRAFLSVISHENSKEEDGDWRAVVDKTATGEGYGQVGVVRIHDLELLKSYDGNFLMEFIAISAGEFLSVPGDNVGISRTAFHRWEMERRVEESDVYMFYNVMLIERRDGIAERRGLGRVEKVRWERLALEEVEITLG